MKLDGYFEHPERTDGLFDLDLLLIQLQTVLGRSGFRDLLGGNGTEDTVTFPALHGDSDLGGFQFYGQFLCLRKPLGCQFLFMRLLQLDIVPVLLGSSTPSFFGRT